MPVAVKITLSLLIIIALGTLLYFAAIILLVRTKRRKK